MTNKEIDLVITMLEAYLDHLSCAGCNDTPAEWLSEFTSKELADMVHDFNVFNKSDIEDFDDPKYPLPDYCYVALMQDKLKHMMVFRND